MKVILQQDIAKLGRRSDIVDVPDGRARNHLLPSGLAVEATPARIKLQEAEQKEIDAARVEAQEAFEAAVTKLNDISLVVSASANESGHLFEALKPTHVQSALSKHGVEVPLEYIHIGTPIKALGEHTVTLIASNRQVPLTFEVVSAK